jgi:hypothetical protein
VRRILVDCGITVADVRQLASRYGWHRVDMDGAPPESHIAGLWQSNDDGAHVAYVDDPVAGFGYLMVPSGPEGKALTETLAKDLSLIDDDRAIELAANAKGPDQVRTANMALGLLAHGPFREDLFFVLVGGLADLDENTQESVIDALAYTTWPEFEDPLRGLIADASTSDRIREKAERLLASHLETAWNREFDAA